ncbi:MAG: Xaa-Pro peptidase family protein [Litorilinea sp.]
MGYVDVARGRRALAAHDIDGLMVVSPENFEYFAGVSGFPVTMWRRAGLATALFAADGGLAFVVPETIADAVAHANPGARVYAYPLWIESVDVTGGASGAADMPIEQRIAQATTGRQPARPEVYDLDTVDGLLREALHGLGLTGKRIGLELDFAPAADVARLAAMAAGREFVNSSQLIREMRLVKSPVEIDLLRRGVALTEHGIVAALQGLDETTLAADIRGRYTEACSAEARSRRELGFRGASTGVHLGPALWAHTDPTRPARRGDLVQFDSTVQLNGYRTDMGRTFTFGPATDDQRRIQAALLAGFAAGMAEMRPGRRFCDIFAAVHGAVRGTGFPSYARGHVGHSIGSDIDGEEWPWISAEQELVLEPGMVLAFEVPYYINGIGGFQNEDDILITQDGHESFNRLPLELVRID